MSPSSGAGTHHGETLPCSRLPQKPRVTFNFLQLSSIDQQTPPPCFGAAWQNRPGHLPLTHRCGQCKAWSPAECKIKGHSLAKKCSKKNRFGREEAPNDFALEPLRVYSGSLPLSPAKPSHVREKHKGSLYKDIPLHCNAVYTVFSPPSPP